MKIQAKGNKEAEILIYEDIGEGWAGGISAKRFAEQIKDLGALEKITVRINSYGGSVFDGFAMYNTLRRNPAEVAVSVDGVAASSASVIAMAGDFVEIAANGFLMIHPPWSMAMGGAEDFRKEADLLDSVGSAIAGVYVERTGLPLAEVWEYMDAETWFTAEDAVELGFADTTGAPMEIAAMGRRPFKNAPRALVKGVKPKETEARKRVAEMRLVARG